MRSTTSFVALMMAFAVASSTSAEEKGTLVFQDDFNRTESQEKTDEVGNGWGTNSKSRAGGNKQVDLRDGAMYIKMHPTADHAVSVRHDAEFRNGIVELRFMLENEKDTLGLDFADQQLKTVHAGHLFKVTIGTKKMDINDMKSGVMDLKIREIRQSGKVDDATKALLKATRKYFPVSIAAGKWHDLSISIVDRSIRVSVDGKVVGAFSSDGFAHPTKRMLRIAVPKEAVVDDLKIYKLK